MTGYQLNAAGSRTRIDEATGRTRLFTYDALNRLTSEQVTGDPAGENGTVLYAHDLVGNRVTSASTLPGGASQSNGYDVNDRLDSDTSDDNGNTLVAMGITFGDVYDSWNRLIRRNKPDGTIIDLGYDHSGNRVFKTVATATNATFTAYLVDANSLTGYAQVLEELREDGLGGLVVFRTYAVGHDVLSQTAPDSSFILHTSYFLYDGQGSVWGLADESGAVTVHSRPSVVLRTGAPAPARPSGFHSPTGKRPHHTPYGARRNRLPALPARARLDRSTVIRLCRIPPLTRKCSLSVLSVDTSYSKAEQTFTFEVDGNQISGFTITLYKVSNGNLHTSGIRPTEF